MKSHRPERIADQVRASLARLLREQVRDPEVGFVTVTDVTISPDLKHAKVFVSVLGGEEARSLAALRRATPFLRRSLAREAGLRFTPELRFVLDRSTATGFRVEQILADARRDDDEPGGSDADAPGSDGAEG